MSDKAPSPFDLFLRERGLGLTEAAITCGMPQSTLSTALNPSTKGPTMHTVKRFAVGHGMKPGEALDLFEAEREWRKSAKEEVTTST